MKRFPAVAGTFYPTDKAKLQLFLNKLVKNRIKDNSIIGAVVPHAGYIYSGHVAAEVYRRIPDAKNILIIGPNHTGIGPDVSVFPEGEWVTPLGSVPVNEEITRRILTCPYALPDVEAHAFEHSIEVQIPFLQQTLENFLIAPVIMKNQSFDVCMSLSECVPQNVFFIASSDFSHYVPDYAARKTDLELIKYILNGDPRNFHENASKSSVCGYGPITTLLLWAESVGAEAELLKYSTSGEVSSDLSSVVGYAAIVFKKT